MILLQLLTSFMTLLSVYMAGNNDHRFNYVGLVNQLFWLVVIIASGTYGLLVLPVVMSAVYGRNLWRYKNVV